MGIRNLPIGPLKSLPRSQGLCTALLPLLKPFVDACSVISGHSSAHAVQSSAQVGSTCFVYHDLFFPKNTYIDVYMDIHTVRDIYIYICTYSCVYVNLTSKKETNNFQNPYAVRPTSCASSSPYLPTRSWGWSKGGCIWAGRDQNGPSSNEPLWAWRLRSGRQKTIV